MLTTTYHESHHAEQWEKGHGDCSPSELEGDPSTGVNQRVSVNWSLIKSIVVTKIVGNGRKHVVMVGDKG